MSSEQQSMRLGKRPTTVMTRARTFLFAVAGGAAVGSLYWAQPLLSQIAPSIGVDLASVGLLVTVTQIGYAVGVFFVVPLGDVRERRRLIPFFLAASAVTLVIAAVAPAYWLLLIAFTLVGATSVAGQMLSPLAGDLADPASRGRVVSTISSGILIGILFSRTISGVVADFLGWRAIYFIAAAITLVLAVLLWRGIPALKPRSTLRYPALLRSVLTTVVRYPAVLPTLLIGAATFGTFSMFWTALTFLLSAPPFSYSTSAIGLIGLAGLAGAMAARRAGTLHDRGWSTPASGAALLLLLASLGLAALGATSIIVLIIAILLFDVAAQATFVLSQTRLYSLDATARSRLNTAFVTSNFMGGAIGSALASVLWSWGGWIAVMAAGAVLTSLALCVWLFARTRAFAPVSA
jgi:predicted MFS family arabinose efflux permease